MNLKDLFRLATINLTHRRLRSWLTLIGIMAGIAAVIALISLGQGLQNAVNEQFNSLGTDKFSIRGAGGGFGPPGTNAVGKITDHDIELIEKIPGIKNVAGRYFKPASLKFQNEEEAIFISSIPKHKKPAELAIDFYKFEPEEGRLIKFDDKNKIFLGNDLSEIKNKQVHAGNKVLINNKQFTIVGIAKKKGNPIFDKTILMREDDLNLINKLDGNYGVLGVQIKKGFDINEVVKETENKLRKDRKEKIGEETFEISTPQDFLNSVNNILQTIKILLVAIASISLIVGGIGIANTMFTSVLERNKEIGIMKAIGAKNKDILKIFLIESGLLGLVGGAIGIIIGLGIAKTIEFGASKFLGDNLLQANINPAIIIILLLFAFTLGSLSGTIPAKQAAKLKPVDTLRK